MPDKITKRGLHERVADALRQEILNSKPGLQIESMAALAKRFAVSLNTARDALLLLSREGFVEIKHGMGTYVKDRSKEKMIGVLMDLDIIHPRTSYFFRRLVQESRSLLESQGLRVKLYLGHKPPGEESQKLASPQFLEDVAADKLCGAIIVAAELPPEWLDLVNKHHVPCVGNTEGECPWSVEHDLPEMIRQGARHLLERGRRKIALLAWCAPWRKRNEVDLRRRAFRSTLEEFGAPFHESWIRWDLHPSLPGAGWGEFREIWGSRVEKTDGLVICDDMLFQDMATAVLGMSIKVPEQLLVVSHANRGSGIFHPFPVAQMEIDPDLFARTKVAMLLKLIRKEPVSQPRVVLPFRWVEDGRNEELTSIRNMSSAAR